MRRRYHFSLPQASLGVLLLASSIVTADPLCFWPNGGIDAPAQPCDPDAAAAGRAVSCCLKSHTCLNNGLCWDTVFNHVVRRSCTDSQFRDSSCPHYCKTGSADGRMADLRQCDGQNDNWVCGQNVSSCSNSFNVPYGFVKDMRNSSMNNILAAGPARDSSSNSSSTNQTTANIPVPDSGPSASTVGIAVGLGVGIPLLLALAASILFLFRARKELASLRSAQVGPGPDHVVGGSVVGSPEERKIEPAPSTIATGYQSYPTIRDQSESQYHNQHSWAPGHAPPQNAQSPQELDARLGVHEVPLEPQRF